MPLSVVIGCFAVAIPIACLIIELWVMPFSDKAGHYFWILVLSLTTIMNVLFLLHTLKLI